MVKEKCCYYCKFCLVRDSRFCSCGLTLYGGMFTSMILIDPRTGVKNLCPLEKGNITLEAYERYKEALKNAKYK